MSEQHQSNHPGSTPDLVHQVDWTRNRSLSLPPSPSHSPSRPMLPHLQVMSLPLTSGVSWTGVAPPPGLQAGLKAAAAGRPSRPPERRVQEQLQRKLLLRELPLHPLCLQQPAAAAEPLHHPGPQGLHTGTDPTDLTVLTPPHASSPPPSLPPPVSSITSSTSTCLTTNSICLTSINFSTYMSCFHNLLLHLSHPLTSICLPSPTSTYITLITFCVSQLSHLHHLLHLSQLLNSSTSTRLTSSTFTFLTIFLSSCLTSPSSTCVSPLSPPPPLPVSAPLPQS